MSKMISDANLLKIYRTMEKICIDLNSIIVAIDQVMEKHEFFPIGGQLRWDCSPSLNTPKEWLPYFTLRLYKTGRVQRRAIGINILFSDLEQDQNVIPFITCGLQISNQAIASYKNDSFYSAGWAVDDPDCNIEVIEGTPFSRTIIGNDHIYSYFIKLTSINTIETIENNIVLPLKKIYGVQPIENISALVEIGKEICEKTISLEQIKGESQLI
jgi:hypothetical protein